MRGTPMPDSVEPLALYRAQADEMIAAAAKTPLPAINVALFEAIAVAHGVRAKPLRNTLLDGAQP
jgi:hypothetical protein